LEWCRCFARATRRGWTTRVPISLTVDGPIGGGVAPTSMAFRHTSVTEKGMREVQIPMVRQYGGFFHNNALVEVDHLSLRCHYHSGDPFVWLPFYSCSIALPIFSCSFVTKYHSRSSWLHDTSPGTIFLQSTLMYYGRRTTTSYCLILSTTLESSRQRRTTPKPFHL
jgi:hypothetical protein